jgi:hypothetical protein
MRIVLIMHRNGRYIVHFRAEPLKMRMRMKKSFTMVNYDESRV